MSLRRAALCQKALAEVIHTALSREPGDRFEDVEEFREELLPWT